MLKEKTRKRLSAAVAAADSLRQHLERALRKIDEEPDQIVFVENADQLKNWLTEQAERFRSRRDAEPRSSEGYRFFDGKTEGFTAVLRYLNESASVQSRHAADRGYLSAKATSSDDSVRIEPPVLLSQQPDDQHQQPQASAGAGPHTPTQQSEDDSEYANVSPESTRLTASFELGDTGFA